MTIRTYQTGDEVAQVGIYNEAAASLPKFKPATVDEVRRRLRGPDFDPLARFVALDAGKPVGYVSFAASGRLSFPWCRKGHEGHAPALLDRAAEAMRQRGHATAFAAYRADWPEQIAFLESRGFVRKREMINYVLDLVEMPTPAARTSAGVCPLTPADVPALMRLGAGVLRGDEAQVRKALFDSPYFRPDALFCLRSRSDDSVVAAAALVVGEGFAKPGQVDANMPCFRLGAFGTEGLTHKRVTGLFSFLVADGRDVSALGLDLLAHASNRVADVDVETFAAQVPSDAAHLARFYKSLFRRQGGFPILEREL